MFNDWMKKISELKDIKSVTWEFVNEDNIKFIFEDEDRNVFAIPIQYESDGIRQAAKILTSALLSKMLEKPVFPFIDEFYQGLVEALEQFRVIQ